MARDVALIQTRLPNFNPAALPAEMNGVIDWQGWAAAIAFGEKYNEPNPDYISQMLAIKQMTAPNLEALFKEQSILKVQEMVPDQPSAQSDPFEITELYVAASDFETGNPSYVIITGVWLTTGDEFKCHTGATNIQATLIGMINLGVSPLRCKFKRGISKDRGGRYLLFLMPPD